ncbi:phosphatidylinositol phosphatase PTPRQ [Eucyclogobius newberryi]|uniref:phosphatidylinositol phosphatase PTPRQ n=1 Tax=Eucyclogobius newberryi TaxID=166745 RepID=UPI003B5BBE12
MGGTQHLLILARVCQVVWLTCERHSSPTEVEIAFHPFSNTQDADSFLVTCRTASLQLVHEEPVDRSSCTPDCTLAFHVEDSRGYRVTLRARINNRTLAEKTFDFSPVSLTSFHLSSTTTSVSLAWSLSRKHRLSSLTVHDLNIHSVIRRVNIHSTLEQSHYTVKGVPPGARVKVAVMVSASLKHPNVTLKQHLSMAIQTARCVPGWLANTIHCYTVQKKALAWSQAQQSCSDVAAGSNLADLKTRQDLHFITSHLMIHNSLLLLWAALNDRLTPGRTVWSDGSLDNMTNNVMSSVLPKNQSNCYVLQRNAMGPGFLLTPFFCSTPLPFICHYHMPSEASSVFFHLVQVTEREVELQWSEPSTLNSLNRLSLDVFLFYQQDELADFRKDREQSRKHNHKHIRKLVKIPIALSSSGVTVAGLFPGSVYSFSLQASHPAGFKWSLGQSQTAHTRPFPPQNVTVREATEDQISVHWLLTEAHYLSEWSFIVHYTDMVLKEEKIAGMANISESFKSSGQKSFTAVIGGLVSYRNYSIEVYAVTNYGIKSCGQVPVLVRTAVRAPNGLMAGNSAENLTVCWTTQPVDPPDEYEVTSLSLNNNNTKSTLVLPGRSEAFGDTLCLSLGTFFPGQTYTIGVVAVKGNDRSLKTSMLHTAKPMSVLVAVPLLVSSTSVQLYVQHPQVGLTDGVKVCICSNICDPICEDLICGYTCDWHALHAEVRNVTISNLRPGSELQFKVYSTSRTQTGPPIFTKQIRTSLAPPSRLREGVVTHSSIELLWDLAQGHAGSYKVLCYNCNHTHNMVQKVPSRSATFSSLTPGTLYHFAVRTEKELFPDSSPVDINITAAPSTVELSIVNKSTSSICISWTLGRGVVSGFELSVKNVTAKQAPRWHCFQRLTPGTMYTFEVTSLSGERRSQPAVISLHTTPQAPQDVTLSQQGVTTVFVAWRPPPGLVDGYKVCYGQQFVNITFWKHVYFHEISHLTPGSEYGLSLQSVLGSDFSSVVHRQFHTRPAGVRGLRLDNINTSSVSISWNDAVGDFDFHRITVANASVTSTFSIQKEKRVAMVAGLQDGCTYNLSVERVKGEHVGSAASLRVSRVPAPVREVHVRNVSSHNFSLHWAKAEGCVDHYHVTLRPDQGQVTVRPAHSGHIQADVVSVTPSTVYNVTVSVAASSHISPGVSRMISTRNNVPSTPFSLEGHTSGSNGIFLSWAMADTAYTGFIIRQREVCPYPATDFTEVMLGDSLFELRTDLISGSTYQFQVAAIVSSGVSGAFSKSLFVKTAESPPGHVTNLTAFAHNHSYVVVTWYLPNRINGLITKFSVNVKHARNGIVVRRLNVNAEEIMSIALPHCNDAAEILSRATVSPLEMTASSPPITLSAVPPASLWQVPIYVGVDQLRPFTPYLFEVSAFTSEGEGKTGSVMIQMPETAPEDSPQNLTILNMTSRLILLSWSSPRILTGKFSYVLYLHDPTGHFLNESTSDTYFEFSSLMPYTTYTVVVRAKSAGELGPAAERRLITAAEAPSAVQALTAEADDSLSIRVSWRSPAQPNGPITQYKLQVLMEDNLLQDITLTAPLIESTTGLYEDSTFTDRPGRSKRNADFITSPPFFTPSVSKRSASDSSITNAPYASDEPTLGSTLTVTSIVTAESFSKTSSATSGSATYAYSATSSPPVTHPPWLTRQSRTDMTTASHSLSTRDASVTGGYTAYTTGSGITASVSVREEVLDVLSEEMSYLVSDLNPFTEYTFRVSAFTPVGEGPAASITEKTREQVPSAVMNVTYQNISSTSILVSWVPPLNPNGRITHYTIYGLRMHDSQELQWESNETWILITDLKKYTGYKLAVAASTAVGESELTDEDYIYVFTEEDEPDSSPINLTVVDSSPSTVTLSWSPPQKANGVIQYYQVLYGNDTFKTSINSSTNSAMLTDLKPFSFYNVSVKAFTRRGHGNQTSDSLQLLSGEDVPGGPPNDMFYESVSPSEVNVTWLPPELPNGNITHYGLEFWNSTHFLNLTSSTPHLLIQHLQKYTKYRIRVQAFTRMGPGNFSQPINITTMEDAPDSPPQFLHARKLSDYEVELSWEPPLQANSDILYYKVRVWNETIEQWQNVTGTSVVINVDSESPYNASVSSWTRLGDGGVLMYISFSTSVAEPYDPPHNVTTANMTFSSVTLTWLPPKEPNGIIVLYSIYYRHNHTVTEQVEHMIDPPRPDATLSYTLTGLIGGTNYTLWMSSSTMQGDGGVYTEPFSVPLPEGVPSDSVHNLTAYIASAQAILVSWDPPLEPNGRLEYLLTLQEAALPPNTLNQGSPYKIIRQTTTETVFLFTRLRIYFPYVFNVTPATAAGIAYNHTSTLYLRTLDEVPTSPPLLVSTKNLSSSSIAVVWQRPLEANGEITEYILTLSGPGGTNTTSTNDTSYKLTKLLQYTAYNFSITAATRKGTGPALTLHLHTDEGGPMSPPCNLTIYNHTAVSVWLSWEPALEPNGVVTHYGFRIRELITQTVTLQNSSGPSTMQYLSGFRPHSSYEISVCSYTRVGHGNQFSRPVTFTTNESVSDEVNSLSCVGVSWDSVRVSWDCPDNPNGQILFYEITVAMKAEFLRQEHTGHQYTISGLSPEQQYTLSVAAVNSAGSGHVVNCTATTLSESVPAAPHNLNISEATANSMTLKWAPPLSVPGLLKQYHITAQLLSTVCESSFAVIDDTPDCVDNSSMLSLNVSNGTTDEHSFTVQALSKYRYYRFKVAAVTNAGKGEYTSWVYGQTMAGDPDAPPRDLRVTSTANSLHLKWEEPDILSGPTKYLVQVEGPGVNLSLVLGPGEHNSLLVPNLTAYSSYNVTVTAFTGPVQSAVINGKAIGPLMFQTMEEEPKSPPANVTVTIISDEVDRVKVTFSPPEEPKGNITAYYVYIFQGLEMVRNISLNVLHSEENKLTALIDGLKGGHNYSIQISARNSAGRSPPSPLIHITTAIKAPAKPTQIPQAVQGHRGVAMVTHRSIAIHMPACFYSDDNGPIAKIQVIVAESGVKDTENVTNWRAAFSRSPAPYITDQGFLNPPCEALNLDTGWKIGQHLLLGDKPPLKLPNTTGIYVIGKENDCLNDSDTYCNGPLKPNTVYVFKFRATNINGDYTDSEYSEHIKTNVNGLLTRDEQIILGVLLSFFLAVLLIIIICCSVKLHRHKKEGGTYSPREAEIIETKCKLDQLIAIADMELKQEKINRYSSFFFRRKEIYVIQLLSYRKSLKPINKKSFLQHVEDLCSNDNAKFQEEFSALPKLLQDLATTDADMPCNRTKNRFPNIKPYNNNRVKLLSQPGSDGSDYINASFVSGYLCPNEFIATQGPLPGTVAAFWRMIWETGTRTIVMLTQCLEKGRIRCHKYWPEDDKPMSVFSDILVSKVSEEVFPDWTVRTLRVERHGHYILVRHFNYTSWPEHGVPESCTMLIKFVLAVRTHRLETSTIVVHCSAGVGRTGVFIALDHLIQHVRDHDFVDIYGLVAELRSERMCMVQNLAQYIFLHQSTLELLNSKGNSQSIWFVSYSALEKTDSLEGMEGDVELEWEETTM